MMQVLQRCYENWRENERDKSFLENKTSVGGDEDDEEGGVRKLEENLFLLLTSDQDQVYSIFPFLEKDSSSCCSATSFSIIIN